MGKDHDRDMAEPGFKPMQPDFRGPAPTLANIALQE